MRRITLPTLNERSADKSMLASTMVCTKPKIEMMASNTLKRSDTYFLRPSAYTLITSSATKMYVNTSLQRLSTPSYCVDMPSYSSARHNVFSSTIPSRLCSNHPWLTSLLLQ